MTLGPFRVTSCPFLVTSGLIDGFLRIMDTLIVVPRVTGLPFPGVSSDENDPDCKGIFFIEQLLGIGDEVREDIPEKIKNRYV